MIVITSISEAISLSIKHRDNGDNIGFVPTMGALHQGHLSLIKKSLEKKYITFCSIFVNPTQFNNITDLEKYPSVISTDKELLENINCNYLFLPSANEIYQNGFELKEKYNLGEIETILEGFYRPGHFQGVCQIVNILLDIIKPNFLFLGQKDYQQCMVIRKMIEIKKIDTKLEILPTLREKSGLAMSSRNMRLSDFEKIKASKIYETEIYIKENIKIGSLLELKNEAKKNLEKSNFKIDYIEIADSNTLHSVNNWDGKQKLVILIAAYLNEVRLIDNYIID